MAEWTYPQILIFELAMLNDKPYIKNTVLGVEMD